MAWPWAWASWLGSVEELVGEPSPGIWGMGTAGSWSFSDLLSVQRLRRGTGIPSAVAE